MAGVQDMKQNLKKQNTNDQRTRIVVNNCTL